MDIKRTIFAVALTLCATFAHADLDNFYGTFGVKIYNYPGDLGDYGIEVDYSPTWTFGLGYKFRPLNVYSAIDFNAMTLSSYSENSQLYETYDLRVPTWAFGALWDVPIGDEGLIWSVGGEYAFNGEVTDEDRWDVYYESENRFALVTKLTFSRPTGIGPVGASIGGSYGQDPFYTEDPHSAVHLEVEYPGVVGAVAFLIAGVVYADGGGGGGSAGVDRWDQFYDPYGTLIWRCRNTATGQFVPNHRCAGQAKVDNTWPGW